MYTLLAEQFLSVQLYTLDSTTLDMAAFEIYDVPESLTFRDYLSICQCARTLADGYDRVVSYTYHFPLAVNRRVSL